MKRLCVFCGSNHGIRPSYADAARALGALLNERKIGLVYGGGRVGLMGVVADAVLAGGGEVIGVIPQSLATKELAHDGLRDLRVVPSMHARKALMAELSDGFIALPGGFGTFEELFEVVTWSQLGLHRKPVGVLNTDGFFDPLLALVDHAAEEGFIKREQRLLVERATDPAALLDAFATFVPQAVPKWIDLAKS